MMDEKISKITLQKTVLSSLFNFIKTAVTVVRSQIVNIETPNEKLSNIELDKITAILDSSRDLVFLYYKEAIQKYIGGETVQNVLKEFKEKAYNTIKSLNNEWEYIDKGTIDDAKEMISNYIQQRIVDLEIQISSEDTN